MKNASITYISINSIHVVSELLVRHLHLFPGAGKKVPALGTILGNIVYRCQRWCLSLPKMVFTLQKPTCLHAYILAYIS